MVRQRSMIRLIFLALSLSFNHSANGFLGGPFRSRIGVHCQRRTVRSITTQGNDNDNDNDTASIGGQREDKSVVGKTFADQASRREYIVSSVITAVSGLIVRPDAALAEYKPAVRPTAYRVDSTIPPSLLPIADNKKNRILAELGKGSGTDKDAVFIDTVNLNNVLNKAVFGTINAASTVGNPRESVNGPGFASFVCMGLPSEKSEKDIKLALNLLEPIVKQRKGMSTAIGLGGVPYSTQTTLDAYTKGDISLDELVSNLQNAGVDNTDTELYKPLIEWTRKNNLNLIALAPEREDIETARKQGLQFVDSERRSSYVVDPDGFISLTQDPRFKIYTDRSLLKDFSPRSDKETAGNFYAERILVHEAGATAAAKYASSRPDSLVVSITPVNDVRFLNGINGRIPRVFSKQRPDDGKVTENYVTTILLNPTARDTLSKSNYIRLEIGTSPDILDYQTKVADYLWFSSSPKVNQIPRLMN